MSVYTDTQSFHCYGCGMGGNVIDFLMKIENKSFREILKILEES